MKRQGRMQAHQFEKFARFLEEHPSFSPMLTGQDALVCGFHAGGSFLYIEEMERLIDTQPRFDAQKTAILPSASPRMNDRWLP